METAWIFGIKHICICNPPCGLLAARLEASHLICLRLIKMLCRYYLHSPNGWNACLLIPGIVPGVGDKETWKRQSPWTHRMRGESRRDHTDWENEELCQSQPWGKQTHAGSCWRSLWSWGRDWLIPSFVEGENNIKPSTWFPLFKNNGVLGTIWESWMETSRSFWIPMGHM